MMYIPIRIVIADDHEIFRNGFKVLLKDQKDLELAGEAENGRQLLEVVDALHPDIVITDIKMPGIDGIEATKRLKEKYPGIGIIALSNYNDDSLIIDMLEAGAKGYLLKNTNQHELIQAVKAVAEGESYYSSATSTKLTKLIAEKLYNPHGAKLKTKLTPRETDIVKLVCQQYSNKEIAQMLNLSIRTVESYREKVQEKIGARNAIGFALYAIKHGIYEV